MLTQWGITNKESHTPEAQESRYLDATVRLFLEHFPEHQNVVNDQSLRYLRHNLMQSVEYIGSAERLYKLWSRVCADATPRGLQTIAKFAQSRNLAYYLLGGLKRDLLTRFPADRSEQDVATSGHRSSAFVTDGWCGSEDNDNSAFDSHGGRRRDSENDLDLREVLLLDRDGEPIIFDEHGERVPPPGFDPLAELDPEDDSEYDPDEVLYDPDGEPVIFDESGERVPPPGFDPDAELDPGDDPNYDRDWDNH
jgi:hypothetical protein